MSPQKLSQRKLADALGLSRASIVNIEAGRQHAPLHLLCQIADILGTDVAQFIPRLDDLAGVPSDAQLNLDQLDLDKDAIKGIKRLIPDSAGQRLLAGFISNKSNSLKNTARTPPMKETK